MKILIDIGHPAHVHYFKNIISSMKKTGHIFCIISRDKEVTHNLLDSYKIPYITRGKGAKGIFGKLLYLFKANFIIYKISKKFKPDIFLSFASPYAAQVSYLLGKPHIAFTDTEHAKLGNLAFASFTDTIVTPKCFKKNFGVNHIKFDGYMELSYLHPNYFKPDITIYDDLGIANREKYILIRFVSWEASHDIGKKGLNLHSKIDLVKKLATNHKVFISSEGYLPIELQKYAINISPERMHDALYFSTLFIGEGATMASECAMLGTPAIYINTLECGTCNEQENKYKLLFNFRNMDGVIEKSNFLLKNDIKNLFRDRSKIMINDKIDVTAFMVWLLENFPKSRETFKQHSNYRNFK